jgi:hypothetical protein
MGMIFDSPLTQHLKLELHKQFNENNIVTTAANYAANFGSTMPLADICDLMSIPDNTPPGNPSPAKSRWKGFLALYVTGKQAETDIKNRIYECLTATPLKPMKFHAKEDSTAAAASITTWDETETDGSIGTVVHRHMLMTTQGMPGQSVSKAVADRALRLFLRKLAAERRASKKAARTRGQKKRAGPRGEKKRAGTHRRKK